LLVVDLLDFPGSVWPNILDLLGKKKRIILVGNKVDLLMPDHGRYIKHITTLMQQEFLKKCHDSYQLSEAGGRGSRSDCGDDHERQSESGGKVFPHVISAVCLSAKTGLNLEVLIEKIFHYWKWNNSSLPGDIYIIGEIASS
jgi:ribosome biogenesis GTPase A